MGCVYSCPDDDYMDYSDNWVRDPVLSDAACGNSESDDEDELFYYRRAHIIPSNRREPNDFLIVYSMPLGLAAATGPPLAAIPAEPR